MAATDSAPRPSVVAPSLVVPVLHTTGLFFGLRTLEAYLYPTPYAEVGPASWSSHYWAAVSRPPLFDARARAFEWDHDRWTLNVVGHGLLGSELYFRPRVCGFSPLASVVFAAGASVAWEYAFEGNGTRPSALDLVYTPLAGLVLGEGRYLGLQLVRASPRGALRTIASAVLDPFGELERSLGAPC